jgi:hypothetical protein
VMTDKATSTPNVIIQAALSGRLIFLLLGENNS